MSTRNLAAPLESCCPTDWGRRSAPGVTAPRPGSDLHKQRVNGAASLDRSICPKPSCSNDCWGTWGTSSRSILMCAHTHISGKPELLPHVPQRTFEQGCSWR